MPSDSLVLQASLTRLHMDSGLEDMDEEPEGELPSVDNPTTMPTDMTLETQRTNRDSHEDTRALLSFRANSPELIRHSVNLSRGSYDNQGSDDSHARLIDVQRGEAPAYETIDLNATEEPALVHSRHNSQSARMSGFFNRFMPHRGNNGSTNEPTTPSPPSNSRNSTLPPSHSRRSSAQSRFPGVAFADSHDSSRGPRVGRTHRTSSSAGSAFTLFSRPVPKNNDVGQMNSPSLISLNSISPPLTHTATRTEFAFPRTGPTSEQVKFLSSKETFGRFSVPYGPDAISFAASASKLDLPPEFDSIHRSSISDPLPEIGESSSPMSTEPPSDPAPLADQPTLSRRMSGPNLEIDTFTSPLQVSLSKQKSTPNLGMGRPSLLKSVLKSKSTANIRSDREESLPPRYASATGSYLTVESFQTAHDDGDDPLPAPQIMVQPSSNNSSLVNLSTEGSGSEVEDFFDGEEGTQGNEGEDINGRWSKISKVTLPNDGHRSYFKGRNGGKSSALGIRPKEPQNTQNYSLQSESDSGSEDENETDTHLNHTEVDKTLVRTNIETSNLAKATVETSRLATIGA